MFLRFKFQQIDYDTRNVFNYFKLINLDHKRIVLMNQWVYQRSTKYMNETFLDNWTTNCNTTQCIYASTLSIWYYRQ